MELRSEWTWHETYQAAILEADTAKIPSRIDVARNVIVQHLEETSREIQGSERDRMLHALRMLELLQRVDCSQVA